MFREFGGQTELTLSSLHIEAKANSRGTSTPFCFPKVSSPSVHETLVSGAIGQDDQIRARWPNQSKVAKSEQGGQIRARWPNKSKVAK
jgi:hypothetical protein